MRLPKVVQCKGCGEDIRFFKTRAGKAMPVDVEEDSTGNIVLEGDPPLAVVLPKGATYAGPRYQSHFTTCLKRSDFRREDPA